MPRPNFPAKSLFPQAKPPLRANRLSQRTSIYPAVIASDHDENYQNAKYIHPCNLQTTMTYQCESERASSEPSLGRRQSLLENERLKRQRAEWENFRKTAEQMRSPKNRARRSEQRKRSPSRPSPSNRRCVTCSSIRQIRPMLCSRVDRISTALS